MQGLDRLIASVADDAPPAELSPVLKGLWWQRKGDWNRAHETVQAIDSVAAAWVHAHLHRVEGDLDNAQYWYRQAGRPVCTAALEREWRTIAEALLREERRA